MGPSVDRYSLPLIDGCFLGLTAVKRPSSRAEVGGVLFGESVTSDCKFFASQSNALSAGPFTRHNAAHPVAHCVRRMT